MNILNSTKLHFEKRRDKRFNFSHKHVKNAASIEETIHLYSDILYLLTDQQSLRKVMESYPL